MARVGILLPVFNSEDTLAEALDSLLAQTFTDWETWILDDGSTDSSRELARSYEQKDGRFHCVLLPHRGIPHTLNEGLRLCQTPLVARMDADDLCAPGRLEAQVSLLESQPDLGVVATRIRSFHTDGRPPGSGMSRYVSWVNGLLTPSDHFRERYVESGVAHSSILAPREVLAAGYRDLEFCEDYDLWLHLMQRGVRFAKVPEVLLAVRDEPGRISRNDSRYSQRMLRRCKLVHLLDPQVGPIAGRRRLLFWGAGRVGKRWLRDLPDFDVTVDAVVDLHPRKLGLRIHGALVIPPEALGTHWRKLSSPFLLAAVGARGARGEIRSHLQGLGFRELEDFLFVA